MEEDFRLSKVQILIQQEKYTEAEKVLKELLSGDANNIYYLSMMAEINLRLGKVDSANSIINNAIGLSPDTPYLFYIKARIALDTDDLNEAEKSIYKAIELDPNDADYFGILANIKLQRKDYQEALDHANKALEIDSENLIGLNIRSTSLLKLNRQEESFSTIEGALREDPTNAFTHANYGWGLLEKGEHKKALNHFKESLKSNPNFDYAQAGMMEAIKATNPVYRLFLKYAFWMANMKSQFQWGVILGIYFGSKILRSISKSYPALEPYIFPIIVLLAIFAFSTWVINPISNLFLRFNPYGNLLLDKNEKSSSNFVAISFGVFIIGLLLYFIMADDRVLPLTFIGFTMMVPLSVMYRPSKQKNFMLYYTISLLVTGLLAIFTTFITDTIFNIFSIIYLFGFIAFQWIANYFALQKV